MAAASGAGASGGGWCWAGTGAAMRSPAPLVGPRIGGGALLLAGRRTAGGTVAARARGPPGVPGRVVTGWFPTVGPPPAAMAAARPPPTAPGRGGSRIGLPATVDASSSSWPHGESAACADGG
jgi:hypothetical protein